MEILILDDDPLVRELLQMALEDEGHHILEATDGQQAWTLLNERPVQLLITDWMLPTVQGPELIKRIRGGNFSRYIYIVLLTARTSKKDVLAGLAAGADDYLTKPFDVDEMRARIAIGRRILELETRLRRALDRANRLATWDSVTNLLNRPTIMRHAKVELSRARRTGSTMCLMMLDIDFFKSVNDQHGHLVGDQVLRAARQDHEAEHSPL